MACPRPGGRGVGEACRSNIGAARVDRHPSRGWNEQARTKRHHEMTGVSSRSERRFALVGPGRGGTTLSAALVARGWTALAVAGRSIDAPSTQDAARRLDAPAVEVRDAGRAANLVI